MEVVHVEAVAVCHVDHFIPHAAVVSPVKTDFPFYLLVFDSGKGSSDPSTSVSATAVFINTAGRHVISSRANETIPSGCNRIVTEW